MVVHLSQLALIILFWVAAVPEVFSDDGRSNLSSEEHMEMKRQLNTLNKPAVKSIETDNGDIFDCVDIYKQPAFDHPLLKNFTIPERPSSFPKGRKTVTSFNKSVEIGLPDGGCPDGTVPIRRVQMEDLIRARSNFGKKYSPDSLPNNHHWAKISTPRGDYHGTEVFINYWKPAVAEDSFSSGQLWITSGPDIELNAIEAGWMVNRKVFGDREPRLFVYWTTDNYRKTGCINALCSGFVSVNKKVPLGLALKPLSVYHKDQYEIDLWVHKDVAVWWLSSGDQVVGFWPNALFNHLNVKGEMVEWGGETYNPLSANQAANSLLPPMGSGHWPDEGRTGASYMRNILVTNTNNYLVDAPEDVSKVADRPLCYDLEDKGNKGDWHRHMYFGGPGGLC